MSRMFIGNYIPKPSTPVVKKTVMGTFYWHSTGTFNSSFGQKTHSYTLMSFPTIHAIFHEHWLHQHALKRVHKGHNYLSTVTLCYTLVMLWWCQPSVCFQLTFVNQFWYLMLTMFCSQSKMHLRLAAVGIDSERKKKIKSTFLKCKRWGMLYWL